MKLTHKLKQFQKKYPQLDLRALRIEDRDWTISLAACRSSATLTINGHNYNGIMYQRITHDRLELLNPESLVVELIVDRNEFIQSGHLALMMLKTCEI